MRPTTGRGVEPDTRPFSCELKVRYASLDIAERQRARLGYTDLVSYLCTCGSYHHGHKARTADGRWNVTCTHPRLPTR